jgi:purine-nucleoside phosphorylase
VTTDPYDAAREAAAWVTARTGHASYDALLVLGSGWAPAVEGWGDPRDRIEVGEVPHFVRPVAEGHRGELLAYDLDGVRVLVQSGRTHLYEGLGVQPVVHGVRTAAALGARVVVLTNANGSLRGDWEVGRPVLISDHLNLTGVSPWGLDTLARSLLDHRAEHGSPRPDTLARSLLDHRAECWSPRLRALAREIEPDLDEGVYAQLVGPHYNTAAEAEWLRRVGADLVGMSTVPEAIAARECGMEVAGFSTVTAIEGSADATDPSAVVAAAERTAGRMGPVLADLLTRGARP